MNKDPEAYWFSEALLYFPQENEQDLLNKINEAKSGGHASWDTFVKKNCSCEKPDYEISRR